MRMMERNSAALLRDEGSFIAEKEALTPVQQLNEYIMISLRTMEGSSLLPALLPQLQRRDERMRAEKLRKVPLDSRTVSDLFMLAMGAYSHSRLRQLILGGVTRHVLENSTLPVMMNR